jgi:MarR family transcriptional regulator, 2-MHQ and catechol-resistance regulon repressor
MKYLKRERNRLRNGGPNQVKVDIRLVENLSDLFFKVVSEIFLKGRSNETFNVLPGNQIRILHQLGWSGPKKMKDIAESLSVSMPSATAVIDKMVKARLVQRREDPRDRRVTLVSLADEGRKAIKRLYRIHEERLAEVLSLLPPKKQHELIAAFEHVHGLLVEIQTVSRNGEMHASRSNTSHA